MTFREPQRQKEESLAAREPLCLKEESLKIRELLHCGEEILTRAGIEGARADSWALWEAVSGMSRKDYLMRMNDAAGPELQEHFEHLLSRRAERIPLQHILGEAWFCGLRFHVTPDVLIPRPETELLVEEAGAALRTLVREAGGAQAAGHDACDMSDAYSEPDASDASDACGEPDACDEPDASDVSDACDEPDVSDTPDACDEPDASDAPVASAQHKDRLVTYHPKLLDLCTGSGCIAITLALQFPEASVTASDLSEKALQVAAENARSLGVQVAVENARSLGAQVHFVHSDLFEALSERYDVIVSNPPYIARAQIDTLEPEVREHDPHMALDGGEDGLVFYRRIAREAPQHLNEGGSLFLEIGWDQGETVSALLQKIGFEEVRVIRDLAGLDRVVTGRMAWHISEHHPCSSEHLPNSSEHQP